MKKFFIIFLIFIFALSLRLWNFNKIGRTWDEGAYVELGYPFVKLAQKGDFTNSFWYSNPDHPPLARYFYGFAAQRDVVGHTQTGAPIFSYGFPYAKFVSVLVSSFSIVLVALFGWEFVSPFVGISSAIILAMLPFFLGFSQIATLESFIMFFFTASVYSYFKLLSKKFYIKLVILTGVLSGLALLVKQSNFLLFSLFAGIYFIWFLKSKQKEYKKLFNPKLLSIILIPIVAGITFVSLWPMPFLHLPYVIAFHDKMWITNVNLPPPEVFFGKLHLVPKYYYVVMFFITTPVLILLLFLFGTKHLLKQKTWIGFGILLWFAFPFIQSLYPFKQHGVRYIIEIYVPLALLAGIGLEKLINVILEGSRLVGRPIESKLKLQLSSLIIIILYLFFALVKITPYYIDYFNGLVGGAGGVYKNKSFQLGWWGEGTAEAVNWISNNAKKGNTVGIVPNQIGIVPHPLNLVLQKYSDNQSFDYVVLNYFSVLREGFNDKKIIKDYKKVYSVYADGAPIVDVYKLITQ